MKADLCLLATRLSGRHRFSDIWPIIDEVHLDVVMLRSVGHFDVAIGHEDVVGVHYEFLRCGHQGELHSAFGAKGFVGLLAD